MGRLFVVPTPIGNLEDITLRALRVLREVTLILAEDTRHTRTLLGHYEISTPLLSYHQHNKRSRVYQALKALEEGDVALVSNAGMPVISDPGFELIVAAVEAGGVVDVLPGPSAAITAVVAAALPGPGFLFMGFLPRRGGERRRRLSEVAGMPYLLVLYEAPHRLIPTLHDISTVLGDRRIAVARELTKRYEEIVRGTVEEMVLQFSAREPRGEFTLVVEGAAVQAGQVNSPGVLDELVERARSGHDARTAVPETAHKYGIPRNDVYALWLQARKLIEEVE